ncbi:hypothetical protein ACEV6Q_04100 [Enterobacter ludwigii]|uniref:hypothetical protein n=1 Tax=Enterobacter ludwigii TaxID=299767 RepID=UPI003BEEDEB3
MNDNKEIAIEVAKQWLQELDVVYLVRENRLFHWKPYFQGSERGEWIKLTIAEAVRLVKATRSGLNLMRYVDRHLLLTALQEEERVYEFGVTTKGLTPEGAFNFNKAGTYSKPEMLIISVLRVLEGLGWNTQTKDLQTILNVTFSKKGYGKVKPQKQLKMVKDLVADANMKLRDRVDRLFVNGIGRFCCVQIIGNNGIKLDYDDATIEKVATHALAYFNTSTGEGFIQ